MKHTPWLGIALLVSSLSFALESDQVQMFDDENPLMNPTFEIADGTGSGAWNTVDTPIEVCNEPGKATITYKNSDKVDHQVHTFGEPHEHGPLIKAGASATLDITTDTFDNTGKNSPNNMYDHGYGPKTSRIFFRLVTCDSQE